MAMDLSQLPPAKQQAILSGPALPPPPGTQPNFSHPPNQNIIPQVVNPICLVIVTLALLLRAYSKVFVHKRVRIHDALIVLGYCTYVGYIYCVYDVTNGVGFFVHQWNITVRNISHVEYILQIGAIFYLITLIFGKTAILLQWIEIFAPKGTKTWFYWTCMVVLWINLLFYISAGVAGNLICLPFKRIWDRTVPGYCWDGRPLNFTIGSFNLASDVVLLILPQRVIWTLNMPMKRKMGIALIFAVGLIACAAAALRLGLTFNYMEDPDWLYRVSGLSMGCIAEMTCILLVHCMPGVPSAFRESSGLGALCRSLGQSLHSTSRLLSSRGSGAFSRGSGRHDTEKQSPSDSSINSFSQTRSSEFQHASEPAQQV